MLKVSNLNSMSHIYMNLRKGLAVLILGIVAVFFNQAVAQCNITSSSPEGCEGGLVFFTTSGNDVNGADSIVWDFDGIGSSRSNPAQYTFGSAGLKTVKVTIYKNGSVACTQTINFNVNQLPTADFKLAPGISDDQCYTGNSFTWNDLSSAGSGNILVKRNILFGDATTDSSSAPGTDFSHSYFLQSGGCYNVFMRVTDNKGCVAEKEYTSMVCVDGDMQADFNTSGAAACGTSVYPFTNITQVAIGDVKNFSWDWGDGTGYQSNGTSLDTCYWLQPVHEYTGHGCFTVSLRVENQKGCKDSMIKPNYACNINPNLQITESAGKDAQCFAGNSFTFTHNIKPLNWPVQFLWVFDDPDSGPLNFDNQNFTGAGHVFTKPDLFTVNITGNIAGCPFQSEIDVVTKGPGAAIENKMIPDLVADTQRHQCQIKDTVYFTNNSSYFLNDRFFLDDTAEVLIAAATQIYKGNTAWLLDVPMTQGRDAHGRSIDSMEWEAKYDILDYYFWDGGMQAVVATVQPGDMQYLKTELVKYDNFFGAVSGQRRDNHIKTVWDFGDNVAPQCTTWTRMQQNIWDYSKTVNKFYNSDSDYYQHLKPADMGRVTQPNPAVNEFLIAPDAVNLYQWVDTTYEWMNCNFSRDIIPKHWYTPGEEMCYTVNLTMQDTTMDDPSHRIDILDSFVTVNGQQWGVGSTGPGTLLDNVDSAYMDNQWIRFRNAYDLDSMFEFPVLLNTNGDTMYTYSQYCADEITGYQRDLTKPKQFVGFDTLFSKLWLNPNKEAPLAKNKGICESTGTVSLALMAPKAEGLRYQGIPCYGPVPPYGLYFNWQNAKPGCTQEFVWFHFDSLYDRNDGSPQVFNQWIPQQGLMLNPVTPWPIGTLNLPTWPTTIFKQYQPGGPPAGIADSCGWLTVGLRIQNGRNPSTGQPCIDEAWFHNFVRYTPNDARFTMDKGIGCNPLELNVSLVNDVHDSLVSMTFMYRNTDPNKIDDFFQEIDSVFRRKIDPNTGDTINYVITYHVFADGTIQKVDSVPYTPGVGGVQGCGSELRLKKTRRFVFPNQGRYAIVVTATNTDGCATPYVDFIVIGMWKEAWTDKKVICRNETIAFYDSSLYFLKEPDPITGDYLLRYNYWRRPQRDAHPDGSPRTWPIAQREKVRWDFDQGNGFVTFSGSPTPNPKYVSYPVPGYYQIQVEFTDSLGCADTVTIPINVTGASANFGSNIGVDPNACKPIVSFTDSSRVYDPCYINDGFKCDSVIRYIWHFGDGTSINTTYTPGGPPNTTPTHLYRDFGDYDVKLVIETALGCFDTIVRTISIEGPKPKSEFAIDSIGCVPYTVYIRNLSIDPSPNAIWDYDFGDGFKVTTSSDTTVYHTYTTAGTYDIFVKQTDGVPLLAGASCVDSFPKSPQKMTVTVLPERPVDFIASKIEVCPDEVITFTDTSDAIYDVFQWIFGDGDTLTLSEADGGRQVTHSYSQEGKYIVRLKPNYTPAAGNPKCAQTKAIQIIVRKVIADFTVDSTGMPLLKFTNTSQNGQNYWWNFDQLGSGTYDPCPAVDPNNCPNAEHNYGDRQGDFQVCLIAQSPEGCYDTVCYPVWNTFRTRIFIPNVFTPNGDQTNDEFVVEIEGWVKYEIQIFNRHGDKVFESTDPGNPWNGKNKNTGNDLPPGVYYVVIKYQLRGSPEETYNGTVTLIRN